MKVIEVPSLKPAPFLKAWEHASSAASRNEVEQVRLNSGAAMAPVMSQLLARSTIPAAPAMIPNIGMDAELGKIFGAGIGLNIDFSSLLDGAKTVEIKSSDPLTGKTINRRRIEGAIGGAALTTLIGAMRNTNFTSVDSVVTTLAAAVLGAVVWPNVTSINLERNVDGSVKASLDVARR
jgi:hypothetical protein